MTIKLKKKIICTVKPSRKQKDKLLNGKIYLQIIHLITAENPKYTKNAISKKKKKINPGVPTKILTTVAQVPEEV